MIHASIGSSESARVVGTDIELLVNGNVIANPLDYFDVQTGLFAYDAKDQSDSVYSYATVSGDKAIVCALNFSGSPKSARLDIGNLPFKMDTELTSLTDASDVTLAADQFSLSLSLAAYEPLVFTVTLTNPPTEQPGVDPSNGSGGEANADEQIANGDFSSNGDGWNQYVESSANADFSFENMRAEIEISQPGCAGWNIQLLYLGRSLTQSHTYKLTFTASAASVRSIDAAIARNSGDYDYYGHGTFELSTEPEKFQLLVTMDQACDDDSHLVFEMGNSSIGVTIDDVSFQHQRCFTHVCIQSVDLRFYEPCVRSDRPRGRSGF